MYMCCAAEDVRHLFFSFLNLAGQAIFIGFLRGLETYIIDLMIGYSTLSH